ncbi:MAG: hypothetical protein CMB80_10150 [Flammeovirgaceae bacterium]|nr:hypothetical protein [Flammeovirgaceae bacterium]MBR08261.1 hypothetical protein [Rickettsiales bacterium]HCX22474.1 hypothetical protein [Cytophagales bacterium]
MNLNFPVGTTSYFTKETFALTALTKEEQQLAQDFDNRRIRDYVRGRYCAHQCLRLCDVDVPILKDGDGVPIWPDGLIGSISHTFDIAGAVVAKKNDYLSIGLDIEQIGRINRELWPVLFTVKEQKYLMDQPFHLRQSMSAVIFSLKEAYFKMQFPLTRIGLEFEDISIIFARSGGVKFDLSKLNDLSGTISCDFTILGNLVVSYVLCKQNELV